MDQFVPPSSEFTVPVSHPSLSHSHSTHSLHSIASDLFASDGPPSTRSQSNAAAAVGWESYVAELGKDKVTLLSSNARPEVPISVKPKTKEPEEFTDNRIYVSNIPFSFREIDLANMFTPYGRVVNVEIVMNERGSKGFGFVTLDNREGCERARRELHGCHVQGRIIEVRKATPSRRKGISPQHWLSAVPNEGKFIPQPFLDRHVSAFLYINDLPI
ncbi:hypothetical protein WR25_14814 [Diploscapter pachys]|uniref:RRM domain-containing protein n=1 Tax=Diploscapter pachys TaxID=2018661 RepID=A0A2A2JB56_9BILA|nr:hypothetical protein WR25_14814 [Diploscapter pachys]